MDAEYIEECIGMPSDDELVERIKKSDSKEKIVLMCTGSFNPFHKMHVRSVEIACDFLRDTGITHDVPCVLIVPSSDSYVRRKLGSRAIDLIHREEIIRLSFEGSSVCEKILISDAESRCGYFYVQVLEHYQKRLEKLFPSERIKVVYVCGSDRGQHLIWEGNWWGKDGAIIVERPRFPLEGALPKWATVLKGDPEEISSSKMRKEGIEAAMGDFGSEEAFQYCQKHNLLK